MSRSRYLASQASRSRPPPRTHSPLIRRRRTRLRRARRRQNPLNLRRLHRRPHRLRPLPRWSQSPRLRLRLQRTPSSIRSRSPTSRGSPATRARTTRRSATSTSPASSGSTTSSSTASTTPTDDTIVGSTEAWRIGENQVTQLGVGGDFHWDNVQGRFMTQFGELSTTTPRNDASPARGQWDLADAYRYISEAYGGYHFGDPHRGVNIEAGIFLSYIGLWSYYNFDNWTYQPSYVSSNTPWFFNGVRAAVVPDRQAQDRAVARSTAGSRTAGSTRWPGVGGQIRWTPNGNLILIFNQYTHRHRRARRSGSPPLPHRRLGPGQVVREQGRNFISRVATTLHRSTSAARTAAACSCSGGTRRRPAQFFAGFMAYVRAWHGEKYAADVRRRHDRQPGALPRAAAADQRRDRGIGHAVLHREPRRSRSPRGTRRSSFDYMPSQYVTFRAEFTYRHASVPYFAGPGGVTPPGGNTGAPGSPDRRRRRQRHAGTQIS